MGKCLSTSSVLVVDVSRYISEKSYKCIEIIKNKIGMHNYTQINEESSDTNQIPYKYDDGTDDVIPNTSVKDEIDEIFDDDLDNKI